MIEVNGVKITYEQGIYIETIAFNRFLDNVRKALKGDEECRDSLLAEDLDDMYHHMCPVFSSLQGQVLQCDDMHKEQARRDEKRRIRHGY
jgi:hypothetical protein